MPTNLSSKPAGHTEDIENVSAAELLTINARTHSLVRVFFDHADGGTVTLGATGDPVQVPGQKWDTVWMAPRVQDLSVETVEITLTPDATCDIEVRVH